MDRPDDLHLFRLHREGVLYMSERILKHAGHSCSVLVVYLGKFTHSKKFRLTVTCLDYLARPAKFRVWLKSSGEPFVDGNNTVKAHLKRTEGAPRNAGVVVPNEVPIGFGVTAKSTEECQKSGPEAVVYHQADVGENHREKADVG